MCFSAIAPLATAQQPSQALISDFDYSIQNELGGFYRCAGGTPADIFDQLIALGKSEASAWRIDLTDEAPTNSIGVLIPLYSETNTRQPKPNISSRSQLLCNLVGELGNRRLVIELVDTPDMETVGVALGTVKADQLQTTDWTEIRLPTSSRRKQPDARFIRIIAQGAGQCWFAIDKLKFSATGETTKSIKAKPTTKLRKALWHWHSSDTLTDETRSKALLQLCQAQGITDLYCQIVYTYKEGKVLLRLVDEQRQFNAAAAALGIAVHALDGAPEFVFRKNHARMIRWIEAIGNLNRVWAREEQFQGVHLDNEPYVLPEWQLGTSRQVVINDYIELNKKLSEVATQLELQFGVDIPFWWDARDDQGSFRFVYYSESGQIPLLDALFPLVDNVGIMSYRDRVTGPNGMVALCLEEFKLGQMYDVDVLAAAELGVGDTVEPGTTFGIYPWSYFRSQLATLEKILSHTPGCAGLAIHHAGPFAEAMRE